MKEKIDSFLTLRGVQMHLLYRSVSLPAIFPDNLFLPPNNSIVGELTTFRVSHICALIRQNTWTETQQRGALYYNAINSASFDPPLPPISYSYPSTPIYPRG